MKCEDCVRRTVKGQFGLVYCGRTGMLIENPNTVNVYIIGCDRGTKAEVMEDTE